MMMKGNGGVQDCKQSQIELPPGFRFHPTDEELVVHYLCRKCAAQSTAVPIIAEIDLYKFDPWQLPEMALYGEKEWYFFSPRDRKYPNGSRPNRVAGTGYWKATGADKPVGKPKTLGIKKALVFYAGKAPRGVKTNWIMHEYRLANVDRSAGKKNNLRLDDWVLCRIYNKKGTLEKYYNMDEKEVEFPELEDQKPKITPFLHNGMMLKQAAMSPSPAPAQAQAQAQAQPMPGNNHNDHLQFDTSESVPRRQADSSCCSEQVQSPLAEFKEVQSARPKWEELDIPLNNYTDSLQSYPLSYLQMQQYNEQFNPFQQDMFFMHMQQKSPFNFCS